MNILRIENDYSQLMTDDVGLREKLWHLLRFRQRNYYHSSLYKQKIWDGFINFFDKKSGRFLTGLLPEVKLALSHLCIKYDIIDERQQITFLHDKIDNQFMEQITLEQYQVDLINQALKYHRGIIKSPTGSGKTFIMLGILKCLPPNIPTLFLANRTSIVRQNYKEMLKWGFKNVGLFDGKCHEPNLITCSTIQSLHHLANILPKFRALVVDEIHMMMSPKAMKVYKKLIGCSVRIGVSATPFKYEQRKKNKKEIVEGDKVHKYNVKGYFGPVFNSSVTETGELTTEYMQDIGRCSKSRCAFFYVKEPMIPYDIFLDAVSNGVAQNWHFHQMVNQLVTKLQGRTLILVERLAHGDTLHKLIPNSLWIQGKDDAATREHVIEKLQNAKDNVVAIATSGIFNTGINIRIHSIINAAGGKASHEIIQRIGRGLRPAGDKKELDYYDFIFTINPYLEQHSRERIKVLTAEGHHVEIKDDL
jgi:superfamily II DNA or RNA helicase